MHAMELMHTDVLRCCGRLALESGLLPLAFEMLTRALDKEPTDSNTLILLSKAYIESGDAASVIRMLVNAINTGASTIASDSRVWTVLALCYDQLDGFEDSLHAVTQALLLESYHRVDPDLHVMQCIFFLKQGTNQYPLDALLPYFDKMLESVTVSGAAPNVHVEALMLHAQLLYKYSEFEKARIDLETAMVLLNSKPGSFEVGERLAKISYTCLFAAVLQFLANRPKNSLKLVEDAISSYPHTPKSIQPLILASGMMNSVLEKDLLGTLDRMVLEEPHSAKGTSFLMNYIIARILLQLDPVHNVYGAYGYYQRALNLNISKPYTWISIGSLYLRLGQVNDALSAYTQGSVLALESTQSAEQALGSSTNSKLMINFNHLFGALAWFGIAQAYIFSRDLASAVEALSRSAQFFAKANNPQQAEELQRQIQALSIYLNNPVNPVNVEYTIPDIPFQLLLDLLLYDVADAFRVRERIEKKQQASISDTQTMHTVNPLLRPADSFIKVEDNGNIQNSDKFFRPSTRASNSNNNNNNKIEKRKNSVGTRSRKNSTSVFRASSLSSSNVSPVLNGNSNIATANSTGSTTMPTPTAMEATISRSSKNSPVLVPTQQKLAPLLPQNNFAGQYVDYARPEVTFSHLTHHTASPHINHMNGYYQPVVQSVGPTSYQPTQNNVPLVYQNSVAPSRQMGTYVYYP